MRGDRPTTRGSLKYTKASNREYLIREGESERERETVSDSETVGQRDRDTEQDREIERE